MKIIIIGGGIAGMSAGIYAQKSGFESEIYEQLNVTGGLCSAWNRNGYKIDNCVHWLTCANSDMLLNKLWTDTGIIGKDIPMVRQEMFYSSELDGKTITLWRDKERTRKEMLELSPEDADEINKFIDFTAMAEPMQMPVEKPFNLLNFFDYIKLAKLMGCMTKVMKEYGSINLEEVASRFKHPLLKKLFCDLMPSEYLGHAYIVSYATITSGNGDFPVGGSEGMIKRMTAKYLELGGKIFTDSKVKEIKFKNSQEAEGIILEDGKIISGDYVICATDTNFTFSKLLDKKFMNPKLLERYEKREINPVYSGYQAAFSVDGDFDEIKGTHIFQCKEMTVGTKTIDRINIKPYKNYREDIAPTGKSILQANIIQKEDDYLFWKDLYEKDDGKKAYNAEKKRIGQEITERIETRYPKFKGKITLLDAWTPMTYTRYTNAYNGAYMSFIQTKESGRVFVPNVIDGLKNVLLASQWLMSPGGLPTALAEGKFVVQNILRKEKKSIKI